ncbi:HEAT repeat domain-containing protein, partial [Rubripirellula sp.]
PVPSEDLVLELSEAGNEMVRAKAAYMMGLHPDEQSKKRLVEMLADSDPRVQRAACEALLRSGSLPETAEDLLPLLAEEDRSLVFVARRLLERMPVEDWQDEVLDNVDPRISLVGMLALVNADPTSETCMKVLNRSSGLMAEFLSDADFIDTLRLCQVALHRGKISPDKVVALREQVAEEFPAGDTRMNHELIRLAAYLQADEVAERALEYIAGDDPAQDRTLVAMCLQFLSNDWTAEQRFQILKYYENAANEAKSNALSMYLMNATRDFAKSLSDQDIIAILEQGAVWRNAALAAIYRLPRPIDASTAEVLRKLDRELIANPKPGDIERRLRTGIVAMFATAKDEESSAYLRGLWRTEPERRALVAMALAQKPDGDNWDYLVRSLNVLEDQTASAVIKALSSVDVATDDPMAIRQLILLGVRAEEKDASFEDVESLLEHWTGMQRPEKAANSMRPWQKWYAQANPDRVPAELPDPADSRWDFEQLVEYMDSDKGRFGDPAHGRTAFTKAKCAQCHQFGNYGEAIGPSLSGIGRRFTKREILESVLFPAHVVSDQYASKRVLTLDGRVITGLVSQRSDDNLELRDANNQVILIKEKEIDQILPSNSSIMPSGLLDDLTLQEISDMMAYMGVVPPLEVANRP